MQEGSIANLELLLQKLKRPLPEEPLTILALDPGETTGWACARILGGAFNGIDFESGQELTRNMEEVASFLFFFLGAPGSNAVVPDIVICEDYRVYSWKSDQHKWANLHTPKMVGAVQVLCHLYGIGEPVMQMAIEAKDFCTDEKLMQWGLLKKGERHARDAIRHLCSYLLFDKNFPKKSS